MAIGTHDLSTLKGPFTYEALPPDQIKFAPLNQEKEMNGKEMMEFYEVRFTEITCGVGLIKRQPHANLLRLDCLSPHL